MQAVRKHTVPDAPDANVAFYRGGYAVVGEEPVPGADFRVIAMRRLDRRALDRVRRLTLPAAFRHHLGRAASSTAEQVTLNH